MDERNKQQSIVRGSSKPKPDRIIKLHDLIKKQTILVCISVGTTCCIWIGAAFYGDFFFEIGWDMMFG